MRTQPSRLSALLPSLLMGAALSGVGASGVSAQLISPGALTSAHADLEGIRNCTQCHKLGARGVDTARCLSCHDLVSSRIDRGEGLHAGLEGEACGDCHKDHFGRDFDLLHFSPEEFRHQDAGFDLVGSHEDLSCRECHRPGLIRSDDVLARAESSGRLERTYLGLGSSCLACHMPDDPHEGQFQDRSCAECHGNETWAPASEFDHRVASFALEGLHAEVDCVRCHAVDQGPGAILGAARFIGFGASECSSCHQDPHRGVMQGSCGSCHAATGWAVVPLGVENRGFDHRRTNFPLGGAHGEVACAGCHGRPAPDTRTIRIRFSPASSGSTYPGPVVSGCSSCHRDAHEAAFVARPGGSDCEACHSDQRWTPATFGLVRHESESEFPLLGAHRVTPCAACHAGDGPDELPVFRISDTSCAGCHGNDDPHGTDFSGASCDSCHGQDSFQDVEFDHKTWIPEAQLEDKCVGCHQDDDPHGPQFAGRDCGECHGVERFKTLDFDHEVTRFSLDGAHEGLPCSTCHVQGDLEAGLVGMVFRPLGTRCRDCHGDGS